MLADLRRAGHEIDAVERFDCRGAWDVYVERSGCVVVYRVFAPGEDARAALRVFRAGRWVERRRIRRESPPQSPREFE
jgi:hypothetical protein